MSPFRLSSISLITIVFLKLDDLYTFYCDFWSNVSLCIGHACLLFPSDTWNALNGRM